MWAWQPLGLATEPSDRAPLHQMFCPQTERVWYCTSVHESCNPSRHRTPRLGLAAAGACHRNPPIKHPFIRCSVPKQSVSVISHRSINHAIRLCTEHPGWAWQPLGLAIGTLQLYTPLSKVLSGSVPKQSVSVIPYPSMSHPYRSRHRTPRLGLAAAGACHQNPPIKHPFIRTLCLHPSGSVPVQVCFC